MMEFWEEAFKSHQEMWGFEPATSTILTSDFFVENQVKNVLIPGIGYGRNAQVFMKKGMSVVGIEISQTAIDLAHKHFGRDLVIHHGSVTQMPFDKNLYDGIYCYAVIHLLDRRERDKFIHDCYDQLAENGCMVFTAITKEAPMYGQGISIEKDRFQLPNGITMFFYDRESIHTEFGKAGLVDILEVRDVFPFYLIKCQKRLTVSPGPVDA